MICAMKHTEFQPTDSQWRCPKCNAPAGDFYIDGLDSSNDCQKVHTDDLVHCFECDFRSTGEQVVTLIEKCILAKYTSKT